MHLSPKALAAIKSQIMDLETDIDLWRASFEVEHGTPPNMSESAPIQDKLLKLEELKKQVAREETTNTVVISTKVAPAPAIKATGPTINNIGAVASNAGGPSIAALAPAPASLEDVDADALIANVSGCDSGSNSDSEEVARLKREMLVWRTRMGTQLQQQRQQLVDAQNEAKAATDREVQACQEKEQANNDREAIKIKSHKLSEELREKEHEMEELHVANDSHFLEMQLRDAKHERELQTLDDAHTTKSRQTLANVDKNHAQHTRELQGSLHAVLEENEQVLSSPRSGAREADVTALAASFGKGDGFADEEEVRTANVPAPAIVSAGKKSNVFIAGTPKKADNSNSNSVGEKLVANMLGKSKGRSGPKLSLRDAAR